MNPVIADKIRKLLNVSGRTEAEAETAQMLAAALAEKHNIDLDVLQRQDMASRESLTHREIATWTREPDESGFAASICAKYFEVNALTVRDVFGDKLVFIGFSHHLDVAEHVHHFLCGEFRRAWTRGRGRCKARKQFLTGIYIGLLEKMRERFPDQKPEQLDGLPLAFSARAKRAHYMRQQFGETTSQPLTQKRLGTAARRGYAAGKDIEINPAIKSGPKQDDLFALPSAGARKLLS